MTILEAINDILKYYREHDWATVEDVKRASFCLDELAKPGEVNLGILDKIYLQAFLRLTDLNVCTPISDCVIPDRWVLLKPLDHIPQSIEIDGLLAVSIAQVLNDLGIEYGGAPGTDATKITAKDIENLTMVGYEHLKQLKLNKDGNTE
jgi:hypothetical protein